VNKCMKYSCSVLTKIHVNGQQLDRLVAGWPERIPENILPFDGGGKTMNSRDKLKLKRMQKVQFMMAFELQYSSSSSSNIFQVA